MLFSETTGLLNMLAFWKKVESARFYTIEGNFNDACQENLYLIAYY